MIEQLKKRSIVNYYKGEVMTVEEKFSDVKNKMPTEKTVYDLTEVFKVFGDPTRAKIMCALNVQPLSVSEIAEVLNMTLSAVSHQLRILRNAKLVKGEKRGKEVLYSLDDDHVMKIIDLTLTHVKE